MQKVLNPSESFESCWVRLALPKGRMAAGVEALLRDAGIDITQTQRGYRPQLSLEGLEAKSLKPQSIVEMLAAGSRDVGFAGADWVAERDVELVELLDTELDPVRVVAAAPIGFWPDRAAAKPLTAATEYVRMTTRWLNERQIDAKVIRSYGATEVYPPEDADFIVDNTATGATLRANQLEIFDELLRSSTRLYASPRALDKPSLRTRIEELVVLLRSVLEARSRVLLELNVGREDLKEVLAVIPCMREPTLSQLANESGFAVRAAVSKAELPRIIAQVRAKGGSDILVSQPKQIIP